MSIRKPRPLTRRQLEVLNYLRLYRDTYKRCPVVREVAGYFGLVSTSGAHRHLLALVAKGALTPVLTDSGQRRGYHLTELGLAWTSAQEITPLPPPPARKPRRGGPGRPRRVTSAV